jgi:stage II sporulation protein M
LSRRDDLDYFRSIWIYIGLSVLLFITTIFMGYAAASTDSEIASTWFQELEMLKWIMGLNPMLIMLIIFFKNLMSCMLSTFLGIGLGIMPLIVDTSNGFLVGVVAYKIMHAQGLLYLLAGILPHGIIELPSIFISSGLGLRLGHVLVLSIFSVRVDLSGEVRKAGHIMAWWIAPLLLLAAAIETFITPIVISLAS